MRAAIYAVATVLAVTSQSAFGVTVRVNFAGSVESISGVYGPQSQYGVGTPLSLAESETALGGSIQIGTRFSGYAEYDDANVRSDGQGEFDVGGTVYPNWGLYYFPSPYYPDGTLHRPPIGPDAAIQGEIGEFVGGGTPQNSGLVMEVFDNELLLQNAAPSVILLEGGFANSAIDPNGPLVMYQTIVRAIGGGPGSPLHSTSLVG
ncbi:MAG TPA: hypothetical protein VKF60_09895, partial [Myxococcota bacterium]|nr:hypothetical protein [Myxococcota bacterium]